MTQSRPTALPGAGAATTDVPTRIREELGAAATAAPAEQVAAFERIHALLQEVLASTDAEIGAPGPDAADASETSSPDARGEQRGAR